MPYEAKTERMSTVADAGPGENPDTSSPPPKPETAVGEAVAWIDYAAEQARLAQRTVEETVDYTIAVTRSRLDRFLSTGSAHLNQTLDSLQEVKSEYHVYEDLALAKIKEGVFVAASHPVATCSAAVGLGFVALKRPRRFLYYRTLRVFSSEEAMLSRYESKVKKLRESIDVLKAESEKLEKAALQAEDEMTRGRTKLRQTGKQIQGVIRSAYKIERQAGGLKDVLGELPRREASHFRSQVSNLASEAKKEKKALTKEVTKISNYGISV